MLRVGSHLSITMENNGEEPQLPDSHKKKECSKIIWSSSRNLESGMKPFPGRIFEGDGES